MDKFDYDGLKRKIKNFNFDVNEIKYLGGGVDSNAYLVNNEYVFKFGISEDSKKDYLNSKNISDFFKDNLETNIAIPNIEYLYITDEFQIIGYKEIKGTFLSHKIYEKMSLDKKEKLAKDIASFLKKIHNLDVSGTNIKKLDMKEQMLDEVNLIKNNLYSSLNSQEKKYIDKFEERIKTSNVFGDRMCLCHVDFTACHLLIDDDNNFSGVIDWGGASLTQEYADFPYLLSDGDDEISSSFGMKVLEYYEDINIGKAIEYAKIHRMEYPINTLAYGISNNDIKSINFGKKLMADKCQFDEDIIAIMN